MKSFVVIGLGRFGTHLARELCQQGAEVLAIDQSEEAVQDVADDVTRAVVADVTNREVLRSLGVEECDCGIVAIGSDLSAAVLATMNLKSLGVKKIICKAHDTTYREVMLKLGADEVILPERAIAEKLSRSLTSPNLLEYIELSDDYGIVELPVPLSWVGKNLIQLNVRAKYAVNIIAVKHGEDITVSPGAQYCFQAGDVPVLLGEYADLEKVKKS